MMDTYKPEECTVCFDTYNDALRRPRNLPCGHTFCSQCINSAIKKSLITCPSCRAEHNATSATKFPISYCVEALIRKLQDVQLTKACQDLPRGISKKLQSVMKDQKSSISSLITGCEEVLSQLGMYQGQLREWKSRHHQFQDRLDSLVEQNKAAIELLEKEDAIVMDMAAEGEKGKQQLQAMLGCLDAANTATEVVMTIDKADQWNTTLEDWLKKCHELFPDANAVHTSIKVRETIEKALITVEQVTTVAPVYMEASASSIMDKVVEITVAISQRQLQVEHLRKMCKSVKKLVENGQVYAIQKRNYVTYSAKIIFQNGKLYLHALSRQYPPRYAYTLQYNDVVGMLDPSSTLAFLDLWWSQSRGRIHIRLSPNTGLARQFVLLCTGQQGLTYQHTSFIKVGAKGQPGEWVEGGIYNELKGNVSLQPELPSKYQESGHAGAVWSRWWGPVTEKHSLDNNTGSKELVSEWNDKLSPKRYRFSISTRDETDNVKWSYVFGEVETGLDVLRAAVNCRDVTKVRVVDCGVVLPI
ncbi:hypothetical protein OTU49_017308 [Cherax quadricarinatus]|uniref:RING-type domain-containing protein n=1 Tax=Cherax quadricarinatus TaxID=27406 RepID=A0AAW0XPA3_CHEQU|nr:uncharacterized protein LOC128689389 [Cherax quadricarinatus]XP_053633584.1 uncharacterized protein LOC128689389 [Cherax quadricarinatus]XP_053633585.1 uncharacterized protein LOC128689389 [Cherax quadricarinatus]XP_053633586.1 uncharacterized protein LOC128689389 [Cherax quadricarinatus]